MRTLGDIAMKSGVTLIIENHFNTMTLTAAQTTDVLKEISHPAVGALYDQANLAFTLAEGYEEAIELQKDFIRYVHVKDLVFKDDKPEFNAFSVSHPHENERNTISKVVGEGVIKWPEIIRSLERIGYDGWLSLEYERRWYPDQLPDASLGMKKGAKYLRDIMSVAR
jgi:sugar phosphate isomerase/epimerase